MSSPPPGNPSQGPPLYSQLNYDLFGDLPIPDDILPSYSSASADRRRVLSARPPPKEFTYKVDSIKGPPVVVLTVVANSLFSQNIPTIIGVGPIKGAVSVRADKTDGVQSITLSITGRYISGIEDEQANFLELSTVAWSQSSSTVPDAQNGSYVWPFEFNISAELSLRWKKGTDAVQFAPPQTFAERMVRGSIRYELGVKVKRGMLRPDYKITTPIGYIPITRPPPFTLLRSLAYEQRTPLVGPESDSEGWLALDSVHAKAPSKTLDSGIEIECKLYMAKPLSYTIGTSIPLVLRLQVPVESQNILDELLRAPNGITVRLRRSITSFLPQEKIRVPDNLNLVNRKDVRDLYEAVWWVPDQTQTNGMATTEDPEASKYSRWMHGEIHIGKDVKVSSSMPFFEIGYAVVLLPFTTAGAKPTETKKTAVLQEQKVEMTTAFAPGPRPVRYAPPGYTSTAVLPDQASREPFGGFVPSSSGFM